MGQSCIRTWHMGVSCHRHITYIIPLYICRKIKSKGGSFKANDVKAFLSNGNSTKEVLMIPAGMYMITIPIGEKKLPMPKFSC